MLKLFTPEDEVQLAMLKGIFESEGIHFFVHNDNFGSLRPGIRIALFNKKTIMVHAQDLARAQQILSDFLGNIEQAEPELGPESTHYSFLDKCRMVIEALLFGWVMPGKRWQRKKPPQNQPPESDA
jgi:hypothetical protein